MLTGKSDHLEREAIFWHMPGYLPNRQAPATAMRAGPWKLIQNYEDGSVELYNLVDDIGETRNLAEQMPEKTEQLLARLKAWVKDTGARIPPRNPNYRAGRRSSS